MKKLILLSAIAMSGLTYTAADAQIGLHLGLRIGPARVIVQAPVVVAPIYQEAPVSYDANDDYYYLPDVNAYYNVADQCYFYFDGNTWISSAYLPGIYRNYDWRNARRFEVRAVRPYMHNDFYFQKYRGVNYNWANNNRSRDDHFYSTNDHSQYFNNNRKDNGQPAKNDNYNSRTFNRDQNQGSKNDGQKQDAQNKKGYDGHRNNRSRF